MSDDPHVMDLAREFRQLNENMEGYLMLASHLLGLWSAGLVDDDEPPPAKSEPPVEGPADGPLMLHIGKK